MRSSLKKEDPDTKKEYVFFSDPDVIVRRAESSAAAAQIKQNLGIQRQQDHRTKQMSKGRSSDGQVQFDLKGLENLLSYHPVQPYPFTFISAVKRKLALGDCRDTCKKAYEPHHRSEAQPSFTILKSNGSQNLYQVVQKMDLIRPLKVPDLKIAPKTLEFSRENSLSKEMMSGKFEAAAKELVHERPEKSAKSSERVQRKLDFSMSEGSSIVNSEIEPLKVPNISIASNLSKKKEHIRENSRERENRSKRIKKDDSLFGKQDELAQDFLKRSKSPRHVSRKELMDSTSDVASVTKLRNDRLSFHMPRESDFTSTKPKSKNFATSTAKKDSDKRHRSFSTRSLKLTRDNSVESKSRTCSNESLSERSMKLPDKIATRDYSRNMPENIDHRYKDDFHSLKQTDDPKHLFPSENRQLKQHKIASQPQKLGSAVFKEQTKRISDKIKPSSSKADGKNYIINSEESVDIETTTESDIGLRARSPSAIISMQQGKIKESEKSLQSANLIKSTKVIEESKYTDDSMPHCTSKSTKKDEESFTQSIGTTKHTSTTNESNNLNESTFSEALLDPRKISFRDENRSQQEEFCDLVTPDMNLILRSKRKKQFIQSTDSETDARDSKYAPMIKMEAEQENIQLLHPNALHLQFQAELHLLDSFNESLRQVMDVEKCFYNVKRDQDKELSMPHSQQNEEVKLHFSKKDERGIVNAEHEINKVHKHGADKGRYVAALSKGDEFENTSRKISKPAVKAVEVQTQTVNDIATQTDAHSIRRSVQSRCPEICGITYGRGFPGETEIPQLSLDSVEQFEDLDQIEEISLPSKLRTMSEISLHETTSSIRTETGTEISISTRDVTCSFNKYLDLEIAQLIKDEKQRYDKIEMLFKSREKTLNDRTKKLVKLEEQKRALRDTGQDSRISSVKKKQRALLLKLQQEKDEMNRLKELHKIASQERKLMLQKQRNMFNPQMSTKNILTKLKRSADSQSPRRLSGPMKGYDIRSNSSMSSLVDSDKSQHDRSQADTRLQMSENDLHFSKLDLPKGEKFPSFVEESNTSLSRFEKSSEAVQGDMLQEKCLYKSQKDGTKSKYEIKSRKFEEKMPRTDILRLKSHQLDVESKLIPSHSLSPTGQYHFDKDKSPDVSQLLQQNLSKSISEHVKSESDTLVEELSKKSKPSQTLDSHFQSLISPRERESVSKVTAMNTETIQEEISSVNQDTISSHISEDILQTLSKSSKKSSKSIATDKDLSKKMQYNSESKSSSKRKSSKCQKSKSSSSILTENILRSKSNSQMSEEFIKQHNKRTKVEKEFIQSDKNNENTVLDNIDLNESQSSLQALVRHSKAMKDKNSKLLTDITNDFESKENILYQKIFDRNLGIYESPSQSQERSVQNADNISAKSQVNAFAVSRHSSGESERNYSKSVVVRSQDQDFKTSKKLEQILNAREAALASRKNCVEEWMAWHAKLRAEEDRVARMEQAALKLVTATSHVFSQQDTTVSSDTSDVEGRIELLTEKLAERRIEVSRLKREARKQTKQKLRALEANLLNQIKKYDTTIHEMRKKLESKKGSIKDGDKLAIESKSLADFKVPEIPLKRIQEIYKSSDLLRSRSESDLLSTKRQTKEMKNASSLRSENMEDKAIRNSLQESAKGTKSINTSDQFSSMKMDTINYSFQSIFGESVSGEWDSEVCRAREAKLWKSEAMCNSKLADRIDEIEEPNEYSPIVSERSQQEAEISYGELKTLEPASEMLDLSRQLDFVRLNSKNLHEGISSIENELKALSEMMSRIRQKSNEELKFDNQNEENITWKDVSEVFSKSDTNDKSINVEVLKNDKNKEPELKQKETHSDISQYLSDAKSISYSDFNENKNSVEDVDNVMSVIMKKDETSLSKSVHEIDYKARSKEILNEIEKSIISEHIKTVENDLNQSNTLSENNSLRLSKGSNDVSNHVTSLETDAKSISEVYSNAISTEGSISTGENISTEKDTSRHTSEHRKSFNLSQEEKTRDSYIHFDRTLSGNNLVSAKSQSESNAKSISIEVPHSEQSSKTLIETLKETSQVLNTDRSYVTTHSTSDLRSTRGETEDREKSSVASAFSKRDVETVESEKNGTSNDKRESKIYSEHVDVEVVETPQKSNETSKNIENIKQDTLDSARTTFIAEELSTDENNLELISTEKSTLDREDWTISDSFDVQQNVAEEWEQSQSQNLKSGDESSTVFSDTKDVSQIVDNKKVQDHDENLGSDVEDVSMFVPKGESTNIDAFGMKFDETISDSRVAKSNDELDDILDIIARDNNVEQNREESPKDTDDFQKAIHDSVTKIMDKVEKSIEHSSVSDRIDTHFEVEEKKSSSSGPLEKKWEHEKGEETENKIENTSLSIDDNEKINEEILSPLVDKPVIDISLHIEVEDNGNSYRTTKSEEIVITELEPGSLEGEILPELEIDAKVELAEEESTESNLLSSQQDDGIKEDVVTTKGKTQAEIVEMQEELEPVTEHDSSSEGEQLDNLVETAVSGLETIEKRIGSPTSTDRTIESKSVAVNEDAQTEVQESKSEIREDTTTSISIGEQESLEKSEKIVRDETNVNNKTFDILKDPEYEDISEESLEVSEILDKSESQRSVASQKSTVVPEKYEAVQKSEEVLRILDEITQKSTDSENGSVKPRTSSGSKTITEVDEKLEEKISGSQSALTPRIDSQEARKENEQSDGKFSEATSLEEKRLAEAAVSTNLEEEKDETSLKLREKREQDASSDSSEGGDTPRGVSEIEMDSPRDPNDSRLDIDVLNDDLLTGANAASQSTDAKTDFHATAIVATSEEDIEVMINKLKASLEQPGLEVAELEAKVLRIEQLQIELEIKKLEAEAVSYYVREIPNKPPPPYTPPGGGVRISTSLASPSPPPAVIPSNIEELTAFTEKATALIFKAKQAGEDIMTLEAPPEIYELTKENNETVKKDRRIYNTFLFDLCKETIAEIYRAEYEKPGPSWTKPNVKTKPIMKIPKNMEELNEYVSKEVATLFGFKTKLQRENMVMRWSRKRRDRVDELLAREAQAEEDEWTKFHHDELAVKNGLTIAILDTLIMETVNVVKVAYAKKRKIMV